MAKQPQIESKKPISRKQTEQKQAKTFIIITIAILAVVVILLSYVLIDTYIVKPNITVATVGETKIKAGDFKTSTTYARFNMLNTINQYVNFFGEMGKQYALPMALELNSPETLGENVLDQMIDEVLIQEEADKRNITVSDDEVQADIRANFGYYPDGTPTPAPTSEPIYTPTWSAAQIEMIKPTATAEPTPEETVEATVEPTEVSEATVEPTDEPTPTPFTESMYKKDFKEYQDYLSPYGIGKKDIERIFYNSLLREKLMDEITKELEPREEQVWVRHILVDSEELANEVIQKFNEGEEWYDLWNEYTTEDKSRENGGDLGWMGENNSQYVPEFVSGAFTLTKDGEISKPVESQFGYHIIQLITRAVNDLNASQFNQMKQTYFNDWLIEARESRDDIEINESWRNLVPTTPAVSKDLMNYLISSSAN